MTANNMDNENLVRKVTQIIEREDGSEVKIVAEAMFGAGLHKSIDVYVMRRANSNQEWVLCSDQPDPNWRTMSVDDYINFGRPEKLRTVSHGEIFKVVGEIGKPINNAPLAPQEESIKTKQHPRPGI